MSKSTLLQPEIQIRPDYFVSTDQIVEVVGPFLTQARKERIAKVVSERSKSIHIVLENIYDRGNSSAVMRSAEAMGFLSVHLIETGEKFKAANRVTQGADKWLDVQKWNSTEECVANLKKQGIRICVTSLEASKPIGELDFSIPSALVLGNEKDGISETMKALADERIILPMQGFVQSYNISVAGALCLYHIFQDRVLRLGHNGDLTETEKMALSANYYFRSLESGPEKVLKFLERYVKPCYKIN